MREYDCRYCLSQGLDQRRDCMLTQFNPNAKNEIFISVPLIDDSQKVVRDQGTGKLIQDNRRVGEEEFFNILLQLSANMTDKSTFELHQLFFEEVCLTAFADDVMFSLIEVEGTASEYKGALGDLTEESTRFDLLGFAMDYRELMDCFSVIRSAKKDYERWRFEQSQREQDGNK